MSQRRSARLRAKPTSSASPEQPSKRPKTKRQTTLSFPPKAGSSSSSSSSSAADHKAHDDVVFVFAHGAGASISHHWMVDWVGLWACEGLAFVVFSSPCLEQYGNRSGHSPKSSGQGGALQLPIHAEEGGNRVQEPTEPHAEAYRSPSQAAEW